MILDIRLMQRLSQSGVSSIEGHNNDTEEANLVSRPSQESISGTQSFEPVLAKKNLASRQLKNSELKSNKANVATTMESSMRTR